MAAPRLQHLWPVLIRQAEATNPAARSARAAIRMRALHSTGRRQEPDINQRYGTANEPLPHLENKTSSQTAATPATAKPKSASASPVRAPQEGKAIGASNEMKKGSVVDKVSKPQQAQPTTTEGATPPSSVGAQGPVKESSAEKKTKAKVTQISAEKSTESLLDQVPNPSRPKSEVAQDRDSAEVQAEFATKAPHIVAPRYVHHFDTYGLVRRLDDSGWTNEQAVTIMKAVRLMLADNMGLARDALVSKSQVENETYLFRAACAELKTEVTARRKSEQEKMRTERTQLQHELDILSQRLGQESAAMKDEVKGMFDDRKMNVRNEQRGMESKVQQLNYKITVDLQADAKSDVEGLRWVMTRRVIIALGVVVIMVLGSLKLYSNKAREQELDAKRKANSRSNGSQTDGPGGPGEGGAYRDTRSFASGEMIVKEGDNPAFVSLG